MKFLTLKSCQQRFSESVLRGSDQNPEYTICEQLDDRKGIMGERGVTAGFKSAKKQECKVVVIDLAGHILEVRALELPEHIARRKTDFTTGMIKGHTALNLRLARVMNPLAE